MDITTPQKLFHGTTDSLVQSFQDKLLNSQYWKPGRDFGKGLYTTISVGQARKWAIKAAKQAILGNARPCVLEIELMSIPKDVAPLIFLSDSLAWADFIMTHRKVTLDEKDPCLNHPEIIIGPMADSDAGNIIRNAVQLNKDVHWFYYQITRTDRGRRLDSLRLGSQVVFSAESWESSLRLIGYNVYVGGRWTYHENSSSAESL